MALKTLKNQRVAILEDNPDNRDRWTEMVARFGAEPVPIASPAPALRNLEQFLTTHRISMVLCDNRLFEHGSYADYSGAEAVAASYRSGRGGVLVTAYENADAETFIRPHRRWIPVLIHAMQLKSKSLESGLLEANREVREHSPSRERMSHRTILTIRSIIEKGTTIIVKVMMSQWNAQIEVGFPLELIPARIHSSIVPGAMLIAQVNIEATRAEDLFFENFEQPDSNALKKSKTLFGGA